MLSIIAVDGNQKKTLTGSTHTVHIWEKEITWVHKEILNYCMEPCVFSDELVRDSKLNTLQRQNTENSKQIFPEKEFAISVPISTFMCLWVFFFFFCIFFGGLECVGHSFAYVAHLWFLIWFCLLLRNWPSALKFSVTLF